MSKNNPNPRHSDLKRLVVNISDKQNDPNAVSALSKCPKFALPPKTIPQMEIISSVETSLYNLHTTTANKIRLDTINILRLERPPTPNLTKNESLSLTRISKDESVKIIHASKGSVIVVMNSGDYEDKMLQILDTPRHNKDPTDKFKRNITTLIKKLPINYCLPRIFSVLILFFDHFY